MELGFKLFDPAILTGAGQGTVSTGTPTLTSKEYVPGQFGMGAGLQFLKTGNLAGTLTLEASDASDGDNAASSRWDTYTFTIPAVAAGTDPQGFLLELPDFCHGRLRAKLVCSAGTGAVTLRLNPVRRK